MPHFSAPLANVEVTAVMCVMSGSVWGSQLTGSYTHWWTLVTVVPALVSAAHPTWAGWHMLAEVHSLTSLKNLKLYSHSLVDELFPVWSVYDQGIWSRMHGKGLVFIQVDPQRTILARASLLQCDLMVMQFIKCLFCKYKGSLFSTKTLAEMNWVLVSQLVTCQMPWM